MVEHRKHTPLYVLLAGGDLIRLDELAAGMKVAQGTIYMWAKRGVIPCLRIENVIRFDPEEIRTWLQSKKHPAKR